MSKINISEELSRKLGSDKMNQLRSMVGVEEILENEFSKSTASSEDMTSISLKLSKLRERKGDISKSELIKAIEATDNSILKRIKVIANNFSSEITRRTKAMEDTIKSNMELVLEEKKDAEKAEGELKRETKLSYKNSQLSFENALPEGKEEKKESTELVPVENKRLGFIARIKKLFSKRKIKSEKASFDTKEVEKQQEDLYEKQCSIADKIKSCDNRYRELAQQLKDLRREMASLGKECLEFLKEVYGDVISPLPDITEERSKAINSRVEGVIEKYKEPRNVGMEH